MIILSFSVVLWTIAQLVLFTSQALSLIEPLTAVMQFCTLIAASAQFGFSAASAHRFVWTFRYIIFLSILPILALFRIVIELWLNINLIGEIWEHVILLCSCILSGAGLLLLWETFLDIPSTYHRQMWMLPVVSIFPFISQILDLQNSISLPFQLSLPSFALLISGIGYELVSKSFTEAISFTHRRILDTTSDGIIVTNRQNTIINANPAFEQIIGQPRKKLIGKSISSVLGSFPYLNKPTTEILEFERKRYLSSPEDWQYLNIKISPLMNPNNEPVGRLIIWRDTTKRRHAEDARQNAREEMFVLINAISSGARESSNLQEFLSETIYQIIYPFRSQVIMIFLQDERKRENLEKHYYLASHFGLPTAAIDNLLNITSSSSLFGPAINDQQPFLISNASQELLVPVELRNINLECILTVPLLTRVNDENQSLGCMCLARKEGPVYSNDEITRLTAICDHLASLIDNDRRRKLSIALSERKGLMRDLHDSVSQKLYGLVTLTEAAQAALETGNTIDPSQVLLRIGENARQAVREMRLFLYQMQPPDLEKDGLISAIHHRLAAVEGRADIKARLLSDEDLALSKEKEIELYYIAQEALNNIMRHARAKTVTVKLKQGRRNVILEILDDGCGFDPKNLDRAGLGLVNMKERTQKINGRLKISSKPNEGTRIMITIPRDPISRQSQKRSK